MASKTGKITEPDLFVNPVLDGLARKLEEGGVQVLKTLTAKMIQALETQPDETIAIQIAETEASIEALKTDYMEQVKQAASEGNLEGLDTLKSTFEAALHAKQGVLQALTHDTIVRCVTILQQETCPKKQDVPQQMLTGVFRCEGLGALRIYLLGIERFECWEFVLGSPKQVFDMARNDLGKLVPSKVSHINVVHHILYHAKRKAYTDPVKRLKDCGQSADWREPAGLPSGLTPSGRNESTKLVETPTPESWKLQWGLLSPSEVKSKPKS